MNIRKRMTYLKMVGMIPLLIFSCAVEPPSLKKQLETSYQQFVEAFLLKDEASTMSLASRYLWATTKNSIASMGGQFPRDFFDSQDTYPELGKLKYLVAHEEGPTANLLFWDESNGALMVFDFLKEDESWRFNGVKGKLLNDERVAMIRKGDILFLGMPEFLPSGKLPAVPEEIAFGGISGILDVVASSTRVSLTINGNAQKVTDNRSISSGVSGGLKKGLNIIEAKIEPIGEESFMGRYLELRIRALVGGQEKEVFSMENEFAFKTTAMEVVRREFVIE